MGILFCMKLFVFGANLGRKTVIFAAVSRPESLGNILILPDTLTALKRDIFLIAENRTGEIIACPVFEYSTVNPLFLWATNGQQSCVRLHILTKENLRIIKEIRIITLFAKCYHNLQNDKT